MVQAALTLALFLLAMLGLMLALLSFMLAWGLTHPPRLTTGVAIARRWPVDPGAAGYTWSEWNHDLPDGTRLPVWDLTNPANPTGPIIIISHAWGTSRHASLLRVPLLFDLAGRVILYDSRAHGDNSASLCRFGTRESDDLVHLLGRIRDSAPDRAVILYGFSMGGGMSIVAGAERPDRVIGVIADGPYRWMAEPVLRIMDLHGLPEWIAYYIVNKFFRVIWPEIRGSDRARWAARLCCPLLVMHGTNDPVCPLDSAMQLAEAARDARFVIMPGGTHLDLHIAHEQRYRETIRSFITDCLARQRSSPPAAAPAPTPQPVVSPQA